jgi:hypothetical protein
VVDEYAPLGFELQGNGPVIEVDPLTGEIVLQQFVGYIDPTYTGGGWSLYYVLEGDTKADLLLPERRITTSTILEPAGDIVFAFVPADPIAVIKDVRQDVWDLNVDLADKKDWVGHLNEAIAFINASNYASAKIELNIFADSVTKYSNPIKPIKEEERDHLVSWAGVVSAVLARLISP